MKFDFVFVVLVYRNSIDLEEFIDSVKKTVMSYRIVAVDAFYNNETSNVIKQIAEKNNCDYILIENRGYSFGNNIGIRFVSSHYVYKYLVVSNPDILVNELHIDSLNGCDDIVVAPEIINAKGKKQNPMYPSLCLGDQKLIYKGLKRNNKILFCAGICFSKIKRMLFLLWAKKKKRIYQAHGSFIIFSRNVIQKLKGDVFDESMFLFAEESYLAIKLRKSDIDIVYNPSIKVKHKEDGSMKFRDDIGSELRKSNIYVFEKYYGFRDKK